MTANKRTVCVFDLTVLDKKEKRVVDGVPDFHFSHVQPNLARK